MGGFFVLDEVLYVLRVVIKNLFELGHWLQRKFSKFLCFLQFGKSQKNKRKNNSYLRSKKQ